MARLRWNATFTMAVGGMVGGGIFSVLGVVVHEAGAWAAASFVLAGAVALVTAHSYVALSRNAGDGGALTVLREGYRPGALLLSWLLVAGYVLTIGVYAFTFGHYVATVTGGGPLVERVLAAGVVAALVAVNVAGVKESAAVEIVAVWAKLAVLAGLAAIGLAHWRPDRLGAGEPSTAGGVLVGAALLFVAYQGFELLTYDASEIEHPRWTLPHALLPAVAAAMAVYVAVAAGAAMLVGGAALVEHKEVALAVAGQAAAGTAGKVVVSVAAGLSAASAVNATLFGTSRLCRRLSRDGELPRAAGRANGRGVPARAVVALGVVGAVLAAVGSLRVLVEAASLTFLATFAIVNAVAVRRVPRRRPLAAAGALASGAAAVVVAVALAS
jgi:amino acid transporter